MAAERPLVFTSKSRDFTPKQIKILQDDAATRSKGEVTYLDEMAFWSQNLKGWTGDITGAIFYGEKLPKGVKNAEHFFCFYWAKEQDHYGNIIGQPSLRVTGLPDFDPVLDAVFIPSTNVIAYSRYQHDFFEAPGGVAVDGGREYCRIVGEPSRYIKVKYNLLTRKFKKQGHWYATADKPS